MASQSNGLESVSPNYITPVFFYSGDPTQGPRASCMSVIAAKAREAQQVVYCGDHNGQCKDVMRDLLTECKLPNGQPIFDRYKDLTKNGYFQPWNITVQADIDALSTFLETHSDDLQLITHLVNCERSGKNVLQVFNFAPSFQYLPTSVAQRYERICKSVVVAQYRALAQLAAIRS